MKQSWLGTWLETIGNTATGFLLSIVIQYGVCWYYNLPLDWHDNLIIICVFTVASILRGIAWRRLMERFHVRRKLSPAMLAVIAERHRQQEIEGWDTAHDDEVNTPNTLANAGAAYLISAAGDPRGAARVWPWNNEFWKPDVIRPRRDYVRGLALGLAGLEQFDRSKGQRS